MNKPQSLGLILLFSIVSVSAAAANFDGSTQSSSFQDGHGWIENR